MDIPLLIQLLQNKLVILNNARGLAFSSGDLDRMNVIDKELLATQNTIAQLNILLNATQAANSANMDLTTMLTAGVQAAQNAVVVPDNPTGILTSYDLSTYAEDPLYLQKITDILSSMPAFESGSQIDVYISNEVIGSPITGAMVVDATTKYVVDIRLTLAIMELDSSFGTAGVGARTFNPGNIGNTGTSTATYDSWSDGVAAVAHWLSTHRTSAQPVVASVNTLSQDVVTPVVVPAVVTPAATTTPVVSPTIIPPVVPAPIPTITASSTAVASSTSPTAATSTATSTSPTATSTPTTSTTATSTDPTATSSDPTSTATTTDPFSGGSTTSTSTPVTATSTPTTPTTATSTDPVLNTTASSTLIVDPDASSTPPIDGTSASSTQAFLWKGKGKRRKI